MREGALVDNSCTATSAQNESLEAAIDAVGRERVFVRAKSYGWDQGGAPEWVWWGIVQELREDKPPAAYTRPTGFAFWESWT